MMLTDAEHVETRRIGMLDLCDQIAQRQRRCERAAEALLRVRGCETVDAYFHWRP